MELHDALKFDVNRIGFDRFSFYCDGWCFLKAAPATELSLQLETLDGRVLWEGGLGSNRPDVRAAFEGAFPTVRECCGFEVRLPNFAVPRPIVLRIRTSSGLSWVIGASDGGLLQADPPRPVRAADALFAERYTTLLEHENYPSTATKGNVCFLVSSSDLASGRGDLYVALGLGYRLSRSGYGVMFWPTEKWQRCPKNTDVVLAMLPTHVPFLEGRSADRGGPLRIAWMRNGIDEWLQSPSLLRYDSYLCSSEPSLQRLRAVFDRPATTLRLAAEHELFAPGPGMPGRSFNVISTINYWGNKREIFDIFDELPEDFDLSVFGHLKDTGAARPLARFYRAPLRFFELPRLYNSAKLCIDCYNEVTRPYGNVNSRVFESLACGLPVVCNAPLARDPILETTQLFYRNQEELLRLVEELKGDTQLRSRLGRAGRQEIVEKHSWAVRAEEFEDFLQSSPRRHGGRVIHLGGSATVENDEEIVQLGFYPPYLDNPYQHLMYFALERDGICACAVNQMEELSRLDVFHLHWTAPITQNGLNETESVARVNLVKEALGRFVRRGGVLVWTIHNVLPHETRFRDLEISFRQWLCDHATIVHINTESTFSMAAENGYFVPRDRAVVAPIGSYSGYYQNSVSRDEAREFVGISRERKVFLLFGQVRSYKGIDALVELLREHPELDATFLIVGEPKGVSAAMRAELEAFGERVRFIGRRVDDWEVQYFFRAADFALFMSQTVLNSSSALLALDFGVPVIALRRGNLASIIDESNGVLLDDPRELPGLLQQLIAGSYRFDSAVIQVDTAERWNWSRCVEPLSSAILRACATRGLPAEPQQSSSSSSAIGA